jgi:hypothetical protein
MRRERVLLVVTVLAWGLVATVWLWAFVQARPRVVPLVLLLADEARAADDDVIAVRTLVLRSDSKPVRSASLTARVDTQAVPVVDDIARISFAPSTSPLVLAVEGDVDGVPVHVEAPLGVQTPTPVWRAAPWIDELAMPTPQARAAPAVFPLEGRVSSRLPSDVLVVDGGRVERHTLAPQAQGPQAPDGRGLKSDHSGLALTIPTEVTRGAPADITVRSADDARVVLELLIDSVLVDATHVEVHGTAQATLQVPAHARPSALVVVHAATSPGADVRGRVAVARVRDATTPLAEWLRAHLVGHGDDDDPLLAQLPNLAEPARSDAERALVQRLVPARVRPGVRVSVATQMERAHDAAAVESHDARVRFRGCALVLLGAIALRAVRGSKRSDDVELDDESRAALRRMNPTLGHVLALVAVAMLLVGLDAVLGLMH